MDAFERLRDDHRRLRRLLDELVAAAVRGRSRLIARIDRLLAVHATVEEEVLYPSLDTAGGAPTGTAGACEQHLAIQRDLAGLEALPEGDARFAAAVVALRDRTNAHLVDEEMVLFPFARRRLSPLARSALARRLQRRRRDAEAVAARAATPAPR